MTVYRTYPDMQSILADLMTREWTTEFDRVVTRTDLDDGDGTHAIARRFTAAVAALRGNELFRRILDLDPEQVLPYLVDRRGRSQDVILEALAGRLAAAQEAGHVRAGDPLLLARALVLSAHGFAISIRTMTDAERTEADLDEELTTLVRRYLAP